MALEALHRYFDYCLIGQQDLAGGVNGGAGSSHGGGMKMYYQYALLHLSVLHADFERWEESAEALGECVATGKSPIIRSPSVVARPRALRLARNSIA